MLLRAATRIWEPMKKLIPLWFLAACLNTQHADVRLPDNAPGADCFDRCVIAHHDTAHDVDCVAACPRASRASGSCGDHKACVEHREISKGKTALVLLGLAVVVAGAQ